MRLRASFLLALVAALAAPAACQGAHGAASASHGGGSAPHAAFSAAAARAAAAERRPGARRVASSGAWLYSRRHVGLVEGPCAPGMVYEAPLCCPARRCEATGASSALPGSSSAGGVEAQPERLGLCVAPEAGCAAAAAARAAGWAAVGGDGDSLPPCEELAPGVASAVAKAQQQQQQWQRAPSSDAAATLAARLTLPPPRAPRAPQEACVAPAKGVALRRAGARVAEDGTLLLLVSGHKVGTAMVERIVREAERALGVAAARGAPGAPPYKHCLWPAALAALSANESAATLGEKRYYHSNGFLMRLGFVHLFTTSSIIMRVKPGSTTPD